MILNISLALECTMFAAKRISKKYLLISFTLSKFVILACYICLLTEKKVCCLKQTVDYIYTRNKAIVVMKRMSVLDCLMG